MLYKTNLNKYKIRIFYMFYNKKKKKKKKKSCVYHLQYQPQVSPFLLYIRCKSGVAFVRRCFRDVS